jgi:hypothetical protein
MIRGIFIAITSVVLTAGTAAAMDSQTAPAQPAPHYSRTELHSMMEQAHTSEQYRVLANYFHLRQQYFEQQAKSEKQEWERRSQNTSSIAEKYPRHVDSSRNRYQYFDHEAEEMRAQADRYDRLANGSEPSQNR